MDVVIQLIDTINSYLWGYIVIVGLVCCGLWFTWRSRFMQFRMVGEMFRLLTDSPKVHSEGEKQISSFQAFAVSLASRIGTGNLAGVATAIVVGGPGAVFWMWVMALVGSATAFVSLDTVWTMVDLCMGLLTLCNLIAIILLGKYAFRLLDDYRSQKRQGIKSPTFRRSQIPELEKELECWED